MKGTVKLTEQDLRGIVKESVKKILKEDNPRIYNPDLLEARKRSVQLVNQIADLVHDLFTETEGNDARFHRVADSLLSTLEKYGLQEGYKYPYSTNESKISRIIKESVNKILKEGVFGSESPYYWSISELRKSDANLGEWESYQCVEDSASSNDSTQSEFETPDDAYSDGLEQLKCYNNGHYRMEVYYFTPNGAGDYVSGYCAEIHNGRLKQY